MELVYWILNEKREPVKVADLQTWGKFFESADRTVKQETIDAVKISTVFLGIDHSCNDGPPVLFETMIFGGEHDGHQERCSTWKQAEQMHERACAMVRGEP